VISLGKKRRPALGVQGEEPWAPVLPRERIPLSGARTRERTVDLLRQGEAYKEGGVATLIDPSLGRSIIVTIPAAAVRRHPELFREAHRFADIVLIGRRYEVAGGRPEDVWRAADALEQLRSRR
jgi:hypothetical protein